MHTPRLFVFSILATQLAALPQLRAQTAASQAPGEDYVRSHYTKYEYRIPMRDGVRLFTAVYVPKTSAFPDDPGPYPFMMNRTPYDVEPYGEDRYPATLGPSDEFEKSGYIFVYQDVRGRWMSEGTFVEMRPHIDRKKSPDDVDDSSDTFDTIEFLLKNVPNNNGKVGIWGISYPGFYTSASIVDSHPAIAAASPQAPMTDLFFGDDSYHGGAFMMAAGFEFYALFFHPQQNPVLPKTEAPFDFGTPDGYKFFLRAGNVAGLDKYLGDAAWMWDDQFKHDTYDDYWQSRDLSRHMKNVKCAVLVVGGWYDAEDIEGPYRTFYSIRKFNPDTPITLVEGPWVHGGWAHTDGDHVGDVQFNAKTSLYFRANIQFPFFEHYLKGTGKVLPAAIVFETGTNVWRRYNEWPPRNAVAKTLFFHAGGKLSFDPPVEAAGEDDYVSDPNHPVPFVGYTTDTVPQRYMVDDQRFADYRPDVLAYETDPLTEDVTIAGPISPHLKVASSGTDSDFDVKLIDVYPDEDTDNVSLPNKRVIDEAPLHMGGYEELLRGEPFRAKFRSSWEKPQPLVPGKETDIDFTMPDLYHTFRRGHRIMVQVQSSWFPLTDRNPQTFTDIPYAKPEDFKKATEQIFRQKDSASGVEVSVLPQPQPQPWCAMRRLQNTEDPMTVRALRSVFVTSALLFAMVAPACAEEGMWTFDNPPLKALADKYNFHPTQAWLDHLRLSSVRLNDGGSGSFVSPNGLLLTNHHVARDQLQKNSTAEHNYVRDGFYAATPDQEMKTPDLEINVLAGMEDVTARVQGAAKGAKDDAAALKARDAEIAAIEKESKDKTGLRSDVVTLYNGGEYWLYQYKVYTDVRLVFAPEEQAAFFGGDPDNFTYPRYDFDMALYRVYENGKPLHTDNYLKWSAKGAAPGELVFVSGHPGSTSRQESQAELQLERDVIEPQVIDYLQRRIDAEQAFAKQSSENEEWVGTNVFLLQNSLKVYVGREEALADKSILEKKQAEEKDLRDKVAANPDLQKEYGGAWDQVAHAVDLARPEMQKRIFRRTDSELFGLAMQIVQYVVEVKKPDGERLPQYHEAGLDSLRFQLLSPAPIHPAVEKLYMTTALTLAKEKLGANDEYLQAILQGGDIDKSVDALVDGTKLGDPAFRKSLLDGGEAAVAASTDPMIVAARRADPVYRASYIFYRDHISSVFQAAEEKLGKARFAVYGKNAYPDATFTLRLSYGTVDGYPYNGTIAPPFTTFYGLYDRAASFSDQAPWNLTAKEEAARDKLDLSTPMDFVTTNDITGGNSGSPVVNKEGELVGLIFDGDIESLAGDFVYDGTKNRAVAVHSAGIIEGMRKIYGVGALADELQGKQ